MYLITAVVVLVGFCSISVYLILHFFDEPNTGDFAYPNPREVINKVIETVTFGLVKNSV